MRATTRREFLRRTAALSGLGVAAPWALNLAGLGAASAQSAGDYKALVCLFLFGGNDAYNMVLATDPDSWAAYTNTRNQAPDSIALLKDVAANPAAAAGSPARLGGVLPLTPALVAPENAGRSFALHPMLPGLRDLFAQQKLAVIANAGPLLRPTTKTDYSNSSFPKPPKLFSHNDQQSTWQAFAPEGTRVGWGGRLGDLFLSQNGSGAVFTSISTSNNAVWLSGNSVLQYQISSSGAVAVGSGGRVFDSADTLAAARRILRSQYRQSMARASLFETDHAEVATRSMAAEALVSASLPGAFAAPHGTPGLTSASNDPLLRYTNPNTGNTEFSSLAQQLQVVARMIQARDALGVRRQVFFVNLGGFDTHDNQNAQHANLMARLNHGLAYFWGVLTALGLQNNVTLFTASDFGRTFTSNGDGTDHGWGAHHFVMGGAVRGGQIVGRFPTFSERDAQNRFSSPDQLGNGSLLPSLAVDQYAATLGAWMGASSSDLATVMPNLGQFATRDLGFMTG